MDRTAEVKIGWELLEFPVALFLAIACGIWSIRNKQVAGEAVLCWDKLRLTDANQMLPQPSLSNTQGVSNKPLFFLDCDKEVPDVHI